MSSGAVLVEWMDILSSAEAKVREFFFEKTFSRFVFDECLSPWFPLYSFFFPFLPAISSHPSVSVRLGICSYISAIFLVACGLRSVRWDSTFFLPLLALSCLRFINMLYTHAHTLSSGSSLIWNHRNHR